MGFVVWNLLDVSLIFVLGAVVLIVVDSIAYQRLRERAAKAETMIDRHERGLKDLRVWCGAYSHHARVIHAFLEANAQGLPQNAGTPAAEEACTIMGLREQLRRLDGLSSKEDGHIQ